MASTDSLLWTSTTHADAESAIRALHSSGVDIRKLSILGKGYHSEEQALGFYDVGAKMRAWGGMGAFWGAFWGALHSWLSASRRDLAVLLIYSLMVGFIFRCIRGDFSTLLIATTEQSLIAAAIGLWLSGSSWVTVGSKKIRARD